MISKLRRKYCGNLELVCPRFPFLCCVACSESETCSLDFKCDKQRDSALDCRLVWGKTKEEMVWVRISRRTWMNEEAKAWKRS